MNESLFFCFIFRKAPPLFSLKVSCLCFGPKDIPPRVCQCWILQTDAAYSQTDLSHLRSYSLQLNFIASSQNCFEALFFKGIGRNVKAMRKQRSNIPFTCATQETAAIQMLHQWPNNITKSHNTLIVTVHGLRLGVIKTKNNTWTLLAVWSMWLGEFLYKLYKRITLYFIVFGLIVLTQTYSYCDLML